MNWAHVHLLLNHVPVLGTIFGLALLIWGVWRRNHTLQRAALTVFVVGALVAIPVYLTGEPSEDAVENLAGTAENAIEIHEDAATLALVAVEVLGLIGLLGLFVHRPGFARLVMPGALALAVITAGLMARTANLGGKIRHAELRGAAAATGGGGEGEEH
jgi:uncharacterized membrane protein